MYMCANKCNTVNARNKEKQVPITTGQILQSLFCHCCRREMCSRGPLPGSESGPLGQYQLSYQNSPDGFFFFCGGF